MPTSFLEFISGSVEKLHGKSIMHSSLSILKKRSATKKRIYLPNQLWLVTFILIIFIVNMALIFFLEIYTGDSAFYVYLFVEYSFFLVQSFCH